MRARGAEVFEAAVGRRRRALLARASVSTRRLSTRGCPAATGSSCSSGPRATRARRCGAWCSADEPPRRRPGALRGGRSRRALQAGALGGAGARAARDPAARAACRAARRAAPSFAGRRILLVEDAPENRMVVQAHLRATGCEWRSPSTANRRSRSGGGRIRPGADGPAHAARRRRGGDAPDPRRGAPHRAPPGPRSSRSPPTPMPSSATPASQRAATATSASRSRGASSTSMLVRFLLRAAAAAPARPARAGGGAGADPGRSRRPRRGVPRNRRADAAALRRPRARRSRGRAAHRPQHEGIRRRLRLRARLAARRPDRADRPSAATSPRSTRGAEALAEYAERMRAALVPASPRLAGSRLDRRSGSPRRARSRSVAQRAELAAQVAQMGVDRALGDHAVADQHAGELGRENTRPGVSASAPAGAARAP